MKLQAGYSEKHYKCTGDVVNIWKDDAISISLKKRMCTPLSGVLLRTVMGPGLSRKRMYTRTLTQCVGMSQNDQDKLDTEKQLISGSEIK